MGLAARPPRGVHAVPRDDEPGFERASAVCGRLLRFAAGSGTGGLALCSHVDVWVMARLLIVPLPVPQIASAELEARDVWGIWIARRMRCGWYRSLLGVSFFCEVCYFPLSPLHNCFRVTSVEIMVWYGKKQGGIHQ